MLNQIRKIVSFDIPKMELDQIKEDIRVELRVLGFKRVVGAFYFSDKML
ncbi:MAG: hypothetical protein KC444_06850 [Nitrosopumilus sp.]|nr:hypothetical protein [Nitrosopumilus sp.]